MCIYNTCVCVYEGRKGKTLSFVVVVVVVAIRAEAVYNGCTITIYNISIYIYKYMYAPESKVPLFFFSKGPFFLGLFFPTNDPSPRHAQMYIASEYIYTHGVVSTTGAVYGASSFLWPFVLFFFLFLFPFLVGRICIYYIHVYIMSRSARCLGHISIETHKK